MGYHSVIENEILPSTTCANTEDIMLMNVSQAKKDKYCVFLSVQ